MEWISTRDKCRLVHSWNEIQFCLKRESHPFDSQRPNTLSFRYKTSSLLFKYMFLIYLYKYWQNGTTFSFFERERGGLANTNVSYRKKARAKIETQNVNCSTFTIFEHPITTQYQVSVSGIVKVFKMDSNTSVDLFIIHKFFTALFS